MREMLPGLLVESEDKEGGRLHKFYWFIPPVKAGRTSYLIGGGVWPRNTGWGLTTTRQRGYIYLDLKVITFFVCYGKEGT